jgi:hypothetical protein
MCLSRGELKTNIVPGFPEWRGPCHGKSCKGRMEKQMISTLKKVVNLSRRLFPARR